jgi:hypothetical protein
MPFLMATIFSLWRISYGEYRFRYGGYITSPMADITSHMATIERPMANITSPYGGNYFGMAKIIRGGREGMAGISFLSFPS